MKYYCNKLGLGVLFDVPNNLVSIFVRSNEIYIRFIPNVDSRESEIEMRVVYSHTRDSEL